jgi:glycosyltransferase involved in cell wall biosynthesis
MRRKICFVLPTHWAAVMGGSQYQAKVLIEHLLGRYDADITYLAARTRADFEPSGYRIVKFSDLGGIRRYGAFFDAVRLYRALARLSPDIIYQQVACAHTGIAAFYARRKGARMVWRVTSDRSVSPPRIKWWRFHQRIEQRFIEYGIKHADLILAQTETQKTALARHYGRSDSIVIRNFHPLPDSSAAPKGGGGKARVVWIANLKRLKNPGAFVRLARRFAAREDVEFVMVGARLERGPWLEELMRDFQSLSNFSYLGALDQDRVNALLETADLLVNTSDYEGFSNTFIQAWMRRVPVVSLCVDPDGLLEHRGLGCLSGDEEGLARDVGRLLDDPELRRRIGECARGYALEHHSTARLDELARLLELEPIKKPDPIEKVEEPIFSAAAARPLTRR